MSRVKTFLAGLLLATVAAAAPAQAGVIFQTDFSSVTSPSYIKDFEPTGGSFAGSTGVINRLHGGTPNARIQAGPTSSGGAPAPIDSLTGLMVLSGIAVQPGATGYTLSYDQNAATSAKYTLSYQFYSDPDGPDAGGWLSPDTRNTTATNVWETASSYSIGSGAGNYLAFKWEADGGVSRFNNISVTAVPEPTSLAFAGIACGAAAFARRRHKKNSQKSAEATPETATA